MALIKERLNIDAVTTPGSTGQFEVTVDGERVAERAGNWLTRKFGAGYPDLESIVREVQARHRP